MSRTRSSFSGITPLIHCVSVSGLSVRRTIVSNSACACATGTPGFSLPRTEYINELPEVVRMTIGVQTAASPGKLKPGGITPTTLWRMPSRVISRPVIAGSAPKALRHRPSLNRATWSRPGWSSPASNVRPVAGPTRSAAKNSGVTRALRTMDGSPGAVRLAPDALVNSARCENSRSLARNSRYWWSARAGWLMNGPISACDRRKRRSGSGNGIGRSSTPLTTVNTATLAPIPSASVTIAAVVKPRLRSSVRAA